MKWQLVATVILQISGTPIDHKGKRPKHPTFRQAVYHIRLRDETLICACKTMLRHDPLDKHRIGACWHIEKLYKNELEGVTFTQLGRDMFYPLYTVQALSK